MEKRIIILNLLLLFAIFIEQGFGVVSLFTPAIICGFFFLDKWDGLGFLIIPLFFYDSLYSERLGFYFSFFIFVSVVINLIKKILGKTPIAFFVSGIVIFFLNTIFLYVSKNGFSNWDLNILPKMLFNFFVALVFWFVVFKLIKVQKMSSNSKQLRF